MCFDLLNLECKHLHKGILGCWIKIFSYLPQIKSFSNRILQILKILKTPIHPLLRCSLHCPTSCYLAIWIVERMNPSIGLLVDALPMHCWISCFIYKCFDLLYFVCKQFHWMILSCLNLYYIHEFSKSRKF